MTNRFHNASSLPAAVAREAARKAHECGSRLFVVRGPRKGTFRVLSVPEWLLAGSPARVAVATPGGVVGEA